MSEENVQRSPWEDRVPLLILASAAAIMVVLGVLFGRAAF